MVPYVTIYPAIVGGKGYQAMYFDEMSQETLEHILSSRTHAQRLRDIQGAIINIERYTSEGRQAFDESELVQVWVIYHLIVIGEAILYLPQTLKNEHSYVPWRQMSDTADALVHEYFATNINAVWTIVERDLPTFKTIINALL